jgi:hypothetical protein
MPVVTSHYTLNTGYEKEVENLRRSIQLWNLDSRIHSMPSLGTWRANSNYCSRLIAAALEEFPGRDILRVDADAVFCREPVLFVDPTFDADIAAHVHEWRGGRKEMLGGTMYFRNTKEVRDLVGKWAKICTRGNRCKERNGDLLYEMVRSRTFGDGIRFVSLPPEYCKIFDLMGEVREPVIEHFQASRRFKSQINGRK